MRRFVVASALFAAGAGLFQVSVSASGSVGPGAGKVSPRAAYSQGKALTFDLLVCDSCPLAKNDLDRARARGLAASLVAVYEGKETGSSDDEAVAALCGDGAVQAEDCKLKMELVHYYLARRFKL
ncbi:MAG: hypothetical protein F4Y47_17370 [Acidobacteriia bacterium]|nr:hypothetical protein [Terriglobia bacterium]MYG03672.1 hypothetical protein [Terriglobia bacterium]MYK10849.1 hypothetical protein [Terriglobia bacterium]